MIDLSKAPKQITEQFHWPEPADDPVEAFRQEMAIHGMSPPDLIDTSGRLVRFDAEKRGKKAEWYVYFSGSVCAGSFGSWRTGVKRNWSQIRPSGMSPAQAEEYKRMVADARRQRKEEEDRLHAETRDRLILKYKAAGPPDPNHGYFTRKGIKPLGYVRQSGERLLVPLSDENDQFWNQQEIYPEKVVMRKGDEPRDKHFPFGGRTKGLFARIDGNERIFICEGYATGASIHTATGGTVICAMTANNLLAVSRLIRAKFPGALITICGDDDRWKPEAGNAGRSKAEEAGREINARVVFPVFFNLSGRPTDFNDMHLIEGIELVRKIIDVAASGHTPMQKITSLYVGKEYVEMIGNEEWLFENLILKNQITIIIAKSGGGKTSISFDFITPWVIQHHGMEVFYFDLDSPVSDHKRMFGKVQEAGQKFKWINPLTHGKGADVLIEGLNGLVESAERLDDKVFFFDTLKKFIDVLDKKSVKPFFTMLRQLTSQGATIVLLGHANKHRGADGNLIFEGVGDVISDTDALLFFERIATPDGGADITTVVSPDKGAKVRGLYEPISFHLAPDRTVTLKKDVVPVPNWNPGGSKNNRISEDEIIDRIREFLMEMSGPVMQSTIVDSLKEEPGMAINRIRNVLNTCAVKEFEATREGQIYIIDGGVYNRKMYAVFR